MRELRIDGIFYLTMQAGETEEEAIARFRDIIDHNGIAESEAGYSEQDN